MVKQDRRCCAAYECVVRGRIENAKQRVETYQCLMADGADITM